MWGIIFLCPCTLENSSINQNIVFFEKGFKKPLDPQHNCNGPVGRIFQEQRDVLNKDVLLMWLFKRNRNAAKSLRIINGKIKTSQVND